MSNNEEKKIQGEGDYESAARYARKQRAFVESGKSAKAAGHASQQSRRDDEAARQAGRARAKEHDPRERLDFDDAS